MIYRAKCLGIGAYQQIVSKEKSPKSQILKIKRHRISASFTVRVVFQVLGTKLELFSTKLKFFGTKSIFFGTVLKFFGTKLNFFDTKLKFFGCTYEPP